MAITERQLNKIITILDEAGTISSPTSSSSSTSSPTSPSSSSSSLLGGSGTSTSTPGADPTFPSSPDAKDMPAYPEVDHAEDLVTRGVANPVDIRKKHEDYPEANPKRGRANPLR